jgi:hypothetical protein
MLTINIQVNNINDAIKFFKKFDINVSEMDRIGNWLEVSMENEKDQNKVLKWMNANKYT